MGKIDSFPGFWIFLPFDLRHMCINFCSSFPASHHTKIHMVWMCLFDLGRIHDKIQCFVPIACIYTLGREWRCTASTIVRLSRWADSSHMYPAVVCCWIYHFNSNVVSLFYPYILFLDQNGGSLQCILFDFWPARDRRSIVFLFPFHTLHKSSFPSCKRRQIFWRYFPLVAYFNDQVF